MDPRRTTRILTDEAQVAAATVTGLKELGLLAERCRACPLWEGATRTVFGEGSSEARVVLVGEQPGDKEDLAGRPFVGPAGQLLDRALTEAGIDRRKVYVTNAVKHFKYELRGRRRLHKTPAQQEVEACRPWLERELEIIRPNVVVALGTTAARAIFGRVTAIEKNRGRLIAAGGRQVLVTVHPSYLLRLPDPQAKAVAFSRFVNDLALAAG